jgi:hypothetical protein
VRFRVFSKALERERKRERERERERETVRDVP